MKTILYQAIILCFLLQYIATPSRAQDKDPCGRDFSAPGSKYKYLLAIPACEINKLKKIDRDDFDAGYWMKYCLDSTAVNQPFAFYPEMKNLFLLKVQGTGFYIERLNQNGWSVQLIRNKDLIGIKIFDHKLEERTDCKVTLSKKQLQYDRELKMFPFSKRKKSTQLTIEHQDFVQEFHLFESRPRPIMARINFRGLFTPKPQKPDFSGYLAFNQPRFRPADTIKVKAFVVDKKGKAYNQSLALKIWCYSRKSGGYLTPFHLVHDPVSPGNFLWEIPVTDTFELNQQYYVALQKEWDDIGISGQLYIEDYELDQTNYALQALIPNHVYKYGETISVLAEGTDANGLPVLDGTIELSISAFPGKLYIDQLFVPDTLWAYKSPLDPSGRTVIAIPDSLIPNGAGYLSVRASFLNSNKELHERDANISFDRYSGKWEMLAGFEEMKVYFTEMGKMSKGKITGTALTSGGRVIYSRISDDTLHFPYHPLAVSYEFSHPNSPQKFNYYTSAISGVIMTGSRRHDTLFIQIQNPRKLDWFFTLYKDNKNTHKLALKDSLWNLVIPKAGDVHYYAEITWIWKGEPEKQELTLMYLEKSLDVFIEAPSEVSPGEKKDITVNVTDVQGKPVSGVNITSAGVNTQFKNDQLSPSVPYLGDVRKNPPASKFYRLERSGYARKPLLKKEYLERFGLAKHPYYQLHFPGSERVYHAVEGPNLSTQLSISIHEKDARKKILYIEQYGTLVQNTMISGANPTFRAAPGYQNLVIRTARKRIELDSIYAFPGQAVLVSINLDVPDRNRRIYKAGKKFSKEERRNLAEGILRIKNEEYYQTDWYLVTPNEIIPIRNRYGFDQFQFLGPYTEGSALKLYNTEMDEIRNFSFDPAMRYSLSGENLQIEHKPLEWNRHTKKTIHWDLLAGESYCQLLTDVKELETRPKTDAVFMSEMPFEGPAKLTFLSNGIDQFNRLILKPEKDGIIWPYSGYYNFQLKPGNYSLLLVDDSFKYHPSPLLNLREGGMLYYQVPTTPEKMAVDDDEKLMTTISRNRFPEYFRNNIQKSLLVRFKDFETDKPLSGVQIQLLHADSQTRYYLSTDEWGHIYKTDLKPGSYTVILTSVGYTRLFKHGWSIEEKGCAYYEERIKTNPLLLEKQRMYRSVRYLASVSEAVVAIGSRNDSYKRVISGVRKYKSPAFGSDDADDFSAFRGNIAYDRIDKVQIPAPNRTEIWQISDSTLPEGGSDLPELRSRFKDYAYWQPILYTNEKGSVTFPVHFPDDITQWQNYAAAMNENFQSGLGLSFTKAYKKVAASIAVPRFAIEGDEIDAIGKALNYTGKEVNAQYSFGTAQIRQTGDIGFASIFTRKIPLKIADWHADSSNKVLADFRLTLSNGYKDGEQREIPIFPKGMEKATGNFWVLERDTLMEISVPEHGELVIHAENSQVDFLLQSLQKLETYPYACNEQIASQLRALLARKKIATVLNLDFEHDKTIRKRIQQLEKAQNADGSWGWWAKGRIDYYMTCYITGVLKKAETMGFKTEASDAALTLIKRYLPVVETNQAIFALELLASLNEPWNYSQSVESIERKDLNGSQRLALQYIRALSGLKTDRSWINSLRTETYLGNVGYSGEPNSAWRSSLLNTLKVYEINKRTGYESENKYIRRFFLEQKNGTYGWNNTIETSTILEGILEDVLKEKTQGQTARLKITHAGGANEVVFPYTLKTTGASPVYARYTGTEPVYFTAYTREWIKKPQTEGRHFKVESKLTQGGLEVTQLKSGKSASIEVSVTALKYGEYLMLRVPIPAGCSYGPKNAGGMGELHREYAKNEVQIFIENMTPGTYTYTIPLEPRYTGQQTLNPAQIELMYFPTFQGNNEMRRVMINGE